MPEGITKRLSDFIATSATADWPEDTLELGRRHILDTVASIIICGERPSARLAREFALSQSGSADPGAPILGTLKRASLTDAVFASAMTAHGAEINDFCPSAFVQPGPAVVSATLCAGAVDGADGASALRAVIAGYELCCRLPKALGINRGRSLGYSSHGYGPVFGAATAIASVRRYSAETVNHMLSYCAQQVSGSMQWLLDIDHVEKSFVFAGMPARNGVHAALLAGAGFRGVPDSFDAKGGWFKSRQFSADGSDYDPDYLVDGLGSRFEMPLVAYKRYPVGGPTQPVVQAMTEIAGRVRAEDVERVEIEMPGAVAAFANAEMPALNLPYLCAVILTDGRLAFEMADSMDRKLNDVEVAALMGKVTVRHDPEQEAVPRKESARVTVTMVDGRHDTVFVEHVRGYPPNPMSREDVEEKARELIGSTLGGEKADEIVRLAWSFDQLSDVGEFVAAMVPD